jgi:hypothetical protein
MKHWRPIAIAALLLAIAGIAWAASSTPALLNDGLRGRARIPSTYVNNHVLAANVAETETAPTFTNWSGRLVAVLSFDCANYYVNVTTTASEPAADVSDGTGSERNPAAYDVAQGGSFSLVAPTTCRGSVAYYRGAP